MIFALATIEGKHHSQLAHCISAAQSCGRRIGCLPQLHKQRPFGPTCLKQRIGATRGAALPQVPALLRQWKHVTHVNYKHNIGVHISVIAFL